MENLYTVIYCSLFRDSCYFSYKFSQLSHNEIKISVGQFCLLICSQTIFHSFLKILCKNLHNSDFASRMCIIWSERLCQNHSCLMTRQLVFVFFFSLLRLPKAGWLQEDLTSLTLCNLIFTLLLLKNTYIL